MGGRGADAYGVGFGKDTAVFRGTRINRKIWRAELKKTRETLKKIGTKMDRRSKNARNIHKRREADLVRIGKKMKWK